jgi:hypothetical protein
MTDHESMTLAEYQEYILKIITQLHSENTLSFKETTTPEGKQSFALEFHPPVWYNELSEDVKKDAYDNLQTIMVQRIKTFTSNLGYKAVEESCSCCEHRSKRPRC